MSTRSAIGMLTTNGTVKYIYCHWDGYIEWNGQMLIEHYSTQEQVEKLIALGDLSSLREKIEPDPNTEHNFDNPQPDVCIAYHRDRGEVLRIGEINYNYYNILSMYNECWAEFAYLWKGGEWIYQKWHYCECGLICSEWQSLQEALDNLE